MSNVTRIGSPDDEQPESLTDAQWAAREAARALSLGRYKLGTAFARIAQSAAATETTRKPYPNHAEAAAAAMFGDRVRNVPLVGSTRVELPRPAYGHQPIEPTSHAPASCVARVDAGGFETECGQPIKWIEPIGMAGGWEHVDPEILDHVAVHAY